ncbi:MAG: ABC transporter permease [Candidatus Omnitrophota bacterium]
MIKELFKHKRLIYELAIRDLKVRYRKPFLGFFWMLIMPLCTAIVYKILFSDFMHASSGNYPFFIHLITALLPWTYFANSIQGSIASVLGSKNIIRQISFPKYLLPFSVVLANLINFFPALLVLLGFLAAFHIKVSGLIIFLPVVILIQTLLIVGVSLAVSSLQVIYRDIEYIVQILLMILFFLTPGVYTLEELINKTNPLFVKIYMWNPLVGILNLYRIIFIGNYVNSMPKEISLLNALVSPIICSLAALFVGYYVFVKCEDKFSDHLNI